MARTGDYDPREYQMAVHLHAGDNPSAAARKAGYSEPVVRARAAKIARREGVRLALMEIAAGMKPGELGSMAKARVREKLIDPPRDRTAIQWVRTALEIDNVIGMPELHLHDHTISPAAAEMIAQKVLELQRKEEAIDGTIISEGTGSENQNQENNDGIQIGELAHGFQDRTIG